MYFVEKPGLREARSVLKLNRSPRRTVIPDRHFLPTIVIGTVSRAKSARVVTGKNARPPGASVRFQTEVTHTVQSERYPALDRHEKIV